MNINRKSLKERIGEQGMERKGTVVEIWRGKEWLWRNGERLKERNGVGGKKLMDEV